MNVARAVMQINGNIKERISVSVPPHTPHTHIFIILVSSHLVPSHLSHFPIRHPGWERKTSSMCEVSGYSIPTYGEDSSQVLSHFRAVYVVPTLQCLLVQRISLIMYSMKDTRYSMSSR